MAGVGIHKFDVVACSFALQTEGVTSPHGLLEQEGWRYIMASAPDGVLLELFEFDDPSAPANVSSEPRTPLMSLPGTFRTWLDV